jgi:hypothetical protein
MRPEPPENRRLAPGRLMNRRLAPGRLINRALAQTRLVEPGMGRRPLFTSSASAGLVVGDSAAASSGTLEIGHFAVQDFQQRL